MHVAMVPVPMMQVTLHQVIHVVPMRDLRMAATGAVLVVPVVRPAGMARGASVRVHVVDPDHVLVHVPVMGVVQTTIMEVVDVVPVLHRGMVALRTVHVSMSFVWVTRH